MKCKSCGGDITANDPNCKYCGAPNDEFKKPVPVAPAQPTYAKQSKSVNWGIFIVLLIFFWPAAIIYLIANK